MPLFLPENLVLRFPFPSYLKEKINALQKNGVFLKNEARLVLKIFLSGDIYWV